MAIKGLQGMLADQLNFELQRGAKFIMYGYCISLLVVTLRRSSVHFVRSGESAVVKGLPYSLISLVLGWWGIPWGPIYTISTTVRNFRGGKDVTTNVIAAMNAKPAVPQAAAAPASAGAS